MAVAAAAIACSCVTAGGAEGPASEFELDLDDYLSHVSNPAGRRGCPSVALVRARLRRFDFSGVRVKLVACVPGYHTGRSLHK